MTAYVVDNNGTLWCVFLILIAAYGMHFVALLPTSLFHYVVHTTGSFVTCMISCFLTAQPLSSLWSR